MKTQHDYKNNDGILTLKNNAISFSICLVVFLICVSVYGTVQTVSK